MGYSAYVEVVDEIASNTGTLISTNLLNMAFPLLRYEYGDVAELDNDCSAYNGQVLHKIYGRVSDVLRLDNGHVLTSPGFTILMRNFYVKAYNIQKLSGTHVRMQVMVADGWTKADEKKLVAEMQRFVGDGCEFTLEYVDGFPETKNGKRRYFMNDLSHD
jgi:phenylacetate-CoA ligase